MRIKNSPPLVSPPVNQDKSAESGITPINQNIETILAFYTRENKRSVVRNATSKTLVVLSDVRFILAPF